MLALIYYYHTTLEEKNLEITSLKEQLNTVEETSIVYRLSSDVKAGNACNDYELEAVEVLTEVCAKTNIYDLEDIIGRYYLLDLKVGTMLTSDMFVDYELTNDMRYMDVVFDEIPIGLEVGDYIDVRISFPLGQDYISLSHKQVAEINDSVVKLIVNQEDFYRYESMKTDLATYKSTKIYGAQYIAAGVQDAARIYYPVNLEVLLTMIKDPNIDTEDYSNILVVREQLEEQLMSSDKVDIAKTVTSGKQTISQKFSKASESYEKLQKEKEKEAAREKNNKSS
ncbi:hypothetical protein [Clostridium sp. Marseille-P299]|uniref:hypothetical protein n=1 Tax=Clostridium sp. Marseille-P299 TaxID=1805477 RepID=UPI0011DE0235|nr:hypothetical protein [Clostridium sp. Marseille-P299]